MAESTLSPADADAIGDAITWLLISEHEHPDSPGIAHARYRLERIIEKANRS